ncbi:MULTISPECIES: hypothetical protein [unclassified Devosia]|uniref:hypothetical protein n=1 Tax=unclassified Devosia TaxID=196773 RepID=UPI0025DFD0E5|nr:hypothetical protein [Devosia sp.]MCR6633916.1 hypothetical protein [Devosia sp.]
MTAKNQALETMTAEDKAAETLKRVRRRRSIALAGALALFALTFYVLTIVKMGPALFDRGL